MEWAKVESRCPMCKRRFAAIRRPPKDGVFPAERIVNVPVRDQVYHYFGNATTGPPDPYSEVQCTVCQNTSNDSLLLLCDLCDSASHTYCVGLGATVPEGDWFCQDCTLLRDEHSKDDKDPDCDAQTGSEPNYGNQTKFEKFHQIPSSETRVSILDIVREPSLHEAERSSSNRHCLLSTVVPEEGLSVADTIIDHGSGKQSFVGHGARTLGHCRNVHGRIRALRENWNRFRQGSLSFSSNSNDKYGVGSVPRGRSGQPNSSSFSSQQSTPQKGSSCNTLPNSGTEDIDKAWKMMDVAKSIEKDRRRSNIVHHTSKGSKHPLRKVNTPKEADSGTSKVLASSSIGNKNCDGLKLEKHYQDCAIVKTNGRHKYHMFKGGKPSGVPKLIEGYPDTRSIVCSELPSSTKVRCSSQVSIRHGNGGNLPQNEFLGTLSTVLDKKDGRCSSVPVAENNSHAKQELHTSSSSNLEEKNKVERRSVDNKATKNNDAKSEIQSLVKLNLKLLSRDKKLEVDAFKEVARLATHAILAACGIGQPKPGVRSFPSSICSHVDEVEQVRRSTLMPSSCRECFFVFIKDVVNAFMVEKLDHPKNNG